MFASVFMASGAARLAIAGTLLAALWLATWWAVEVTVSTRRMLPAVIAAFTAALTLALAPHGLVALALLTAHPEDVSRVVAHEPPVMGVLPDAELAERVKFQ